MTESPFVIWIFGLPSAGKTTLAQGVWTRLASTCQRCMLLDGDQLRAGLCQGLSFSEGDRTENLRRAAEVAALAARSGISSIVAMITPLNSQRAMIREILAQFPLSWVWAQCPLEECVRRDVKGLYHKYAQCRSSDMTGIHADFEHPEVDVLRLDTSTISIDHAIDEILAFAANDQSDRA